MGIGIHTGLAIAGNIGSDERLDYTVIGDTVNQTARLEGLTKIFGSDILVTESTIKQISFLDKLHYRYLGRVKVKGKKEEISLFEIKVPFEGENMESFNKTKLLLEKAIQLFFTEQYQTSVELLERILVDFPSDKAASYYLVRARILFDNPNLSHEFLK